MILQGVQEHLEALVRLASPADAGRAGFLLFDAEGHEVASVFPNPPRPAFEIQRDAQGEVALAVSDGSHVARGAPVEVYGQMTGSLWFLHEQSLAEEKALEVLRLARVGATLLLEKNFELDNLSDAVTRHLEEWNFFTEISREFADARDLPDFCDRLVRRLCDLLGAARVGVAIAAHDRGEFRLYGALGGSKDAWPLGQGITGRAIVSGEGAHVESPRLHAEETWLPLERAATREIVVAPMRGGERREAVGALVAIDGGRKGFFASDEVHLLSFVAEYVGSVLSALKGAELRNEMQIARRIVDGMLPRTAPSLAGYELAGRLEPAHEVGGDYYDFIPMGKGRVAAVVADVSGHTLPATLLMAGARSAFHWEAPTTPGAAPMLTRVARHLHDDLASAEHFMSIVVAVLEDVGTVSFASAGHPAPLLRRADGTIEFVESDGIVAGVVRGATYEETRIHLDPGDTLVLYTDGVPEATRGEELFGISRMVEAVEEASKGTAKEVVSSIFRRVQSFCGGDAVDDLTVVVVKRVPARVRPPKEEAPALAEAAR